ncbi:MAG: sialidase family protein [Candidatus Aminicenantes bacterium]|jgi:hypothetical protein
MKKKVFFSLVAIFFFFFLARGSWLPTDIRLDTGDTPGAYESRSPQISVSGSNIYVVWHDLRNGTFDIYFNRSTDEGATWQLSDTRLDVGDAPGANHSMNPQISSSEDNVYVVWEDDRNTSYRSDIYFNYSTNGGTTWQTSDIRLDFGDLPGANNSWSPQISSNGDNVYVVWGDLRNGSSDIYFVCSTDGGATWLPSEIRLDIGDSAGAHGSFDPQISINGDDVYVVWEDARNEVGGFGQDIYFNYSTDGGTTWQATDIRLDTGDAPGANESRHPQIGCSGSNVYVVWNDMRNAPSTYTMDVYFNYSTDGGANWQAADTRLDVGDIPGASYSNSPKISCSGNSVYTVWYDGRNGNADIYFNNSQDGGVTWRASAIRLDTGDTAGANRSYKHQICSNGSNVCVVWMDLRNGEGDIYFNYSTNWGMTWQTPDIRLDTGDSPGASSSSNPQIVCSENNKYSVWNDQRNGMNDIYFNMEIYPVPDIKGNGSDGPIIINQSDTLYVTVDFNAGTFTGEDADWWLVAMTPRGWCYYHPTSGWLPGREVTHQIPLRDLPTIEVLNMSGLPAGSYTFYFGVDLVKNGNINMGQAYYDSVEVSINP